MNESGVWRRGNEGVMMSFKSAMPSLNCCYRSQKCIKKGINLGHSELDFNLSGLWQGFVGKNGH